MTQQHRDALHHSVHAHKRVRDAVAAEALKLAAEREQAQADRLAVDRTGDTTRTEEKTNG